MQVGELGDSIGFLQGTQDGEFDNLESEPCRSWKFAYRHHVLAANNIRASMGYVLVEANDR
jgi:hypothetical protein